MESSRSGSGSLVPWDFISQLEAWLVNVTIGSEEHSYHSGSCFDTWGAWIISGSWRLEARPIVWMLSEEWVLEADELGVQSSLSIG